MSNAAEENGHEPKAKVFISYSRKDMAFADRLEAALKARGFEPLMDRTDILAFEEWWKRVEDLIVRADTIIFVLSPDAVKPDTVALKEIAFAASLNKRFAPIVFRPVQDKDVPEALARLNFIFFDDPAQFEQSADKLAEALNTDISWIRQHTDFGEQARRWAHAKGPAGLLLRSPVLEQAERWIASRPPGAPAPTDETQTFIGRSRRGATRRRNILTSSLATGLVLALGLAGLAYWQRGIAVEQRGIAQQNEALAKEERDNATRNFKLAQKTAESLVFDIAQGLRSVQGMSAQTVRKILETAKATFEQLTTSAPDDLTLQRSRGSMLDEFGDTYLTLGDLDQALNAYREALAVADIAGDNGNSAEGSLIGTPNEVASIQGIPTPVEDQLKYFYDIWGSDKTYPHMAVAWTWAFDTPFSWTKQIASHFGGVRQGMAISWPKAIKDKGGIRNQFHHMIDIVPTILEAAGIKAPTVVDGIPQKPIEGVSMTYTFDSKNANVPSRHRTQYFEMMGDHAIYSDGWIASTKVMRPPWDVAGAVSQDPASFPYELYDLSKDWTQFENVATKYPAKLKELENLFWTEAAKYQVLPLDATVATRVVSPRPNLAAGRTEFTWSGEVTGTPNGDAPSILDSSFNFRAEVEIPQGGGEGMIVTQGGRFGGYGFYVLNGKPVFSYNFVNLQRIRWEGPDILSPGKHTLEFDFKYDGPGLGTLAFNNMTGIGRGGTGVLKVDGKEVARQTMEHTIPLIMQWDENFDIGADTGTPVDDRDYQVPFKFTGKLGKLTLKIDRPQLTPADIEKLKQATRNNRAAE